MNVMEASWVGLVEFASELDPDPQFEGLSDDDVERQVREGASRIAALQCEWLLCVAEFVVRGRWAEGGARTPGQWLSWACGVAGSTAREHVRVGLALRHLPLIRARFGAGTLSYSKVRAISRVAVPAIEQQLIDLADSAPASTIANIISKSQWCVEQHRRWQDDTGGSGVVQRDVRRVQIDDRTAELRIRLPVEEVAAVEERLDRLVDLADRAEADRARQQSVEDGVDGSESAELGRAERLPRGARRAVAVCDALAAAVAAGGPDRSGVDDHLVVLHVDAEDLADAVADPGGDSAGAAAAADGPGTDRADDRRDAAAASATGGDAAEAPDEVSRMQARRAGPGSSGMRAHVTTGRGRGMRLPKAVLARLTCDGGLRVAGIGQGGHPADIGRRSRKVPPDLRRALQLRDRGCRFPGCDATRFLHAHHVVHWARGGPTDLANLLLLCSHHHRFVHDQHWTLREVDAAAGRWSFRPPGQSQPVPAVWAMPPASAASLAAVRSQPRPDPNALQPPWWDGAGYDLNETLAMVTDWILDAA